MKNVINFNEVFTEAEAETAFDQLITVLQVAQKRVRAERDRLTKTAETQDKFESAAARVAELQPLLATDPSLIPDFLEAAADMKKANNTRISREEKNEAQWPAIYECMNKVTDLMMDAQGEIAEPAAEAA